MQAAQQLAELGHVAADASHPFALLHPVSPEPPMRHPVCCGRAKHEPHQPYAQDLGSVCLPSPRICNKWTDDYWRWCAPKHTSICWANPISVRFRQIIAVKRFSCPMSHRHMRLSRSPIQHCNLTGSALGFGVSRLSNFHGCHRASPPPRPSAIPHPQSVSPSHGFLNLFRCGSIVREEGKTSLNTHRFEGLTGWSSSHVFQRVAV